MTSFQELFPIPKPIIGMIHVWGIREMRQAIRDLTALDVPNSHLILGVDPSDHLGVDGVIVENYGWGYIDGNRTSLVAADEIARIVRELLYDRSFVPVGVNLLPNDYQSALELTHDSGAKFIQLDHVTGEFVGVESVDPARLKVLRRRSPDVVLLGGIHPKYYQLVNPAQDIGESAKAAMDLCDAIVVTGEHTGGATAISDLEKAKRAVGDFPVIVGSGLTAENVGEQLSIADGAIVGTAFKKNGVIPGEPVDHELVQALMTEVRKLR